MQGISLLNVPFPFTLKSKFQSYKGPQNLYYLWECRAYAGCLGIVLTETLLSVFWGIQERAW